MTLPVKEDVPVVLGGQRPHRLEKVALGVVALLGGRVCLCGLAEARESSSEELRTVHDDDALFGGCEGRVFRAAAAGGNGDVVQKEKERNSLANRGTREKKKKGGDTQAECNDGDVGALVGGESLAGLGRGSLSQGSLAPITGCFTVLHSGVAFFVFPL